MLKSPPADVGKARDVSLMPESGRFPGGGHGNPLRCSCLENPVDRGAWWATAHGTAESGATKAAEHACVRADTKRKEKYELGANKLCVFPTQFLCLCSENFP